MTTTPPTGTHAESGGAVASWRPPVEDRQQQVREYPELFERWDSLGLVRKPGIRGWFRRHPIAMSAVLVAFYCLSTLTGLPMAFLDMGTDASWLLLGYGVIAVALFFRHLRPVAVLILVALFEAAMLFYYPWQGAQMVGLCFAAYAVAYHFGLRWGLLAAVLGWAVGYSTLFAAGSWRERYGASGWEMLFSQEVGVGPTEGLWVTAGVMFFSVGISTGIGAAVRKSHQHEREILDWARKSHELAQLGERNRIAREMHDVVAH